MSESLRKEFEADDPMEMQGLQCDGDPDFMITCVAEEYLGLGWTPAQVFNLYESLDYPVLYSLLQLKGAAAIRCLIDRAAARCGVFRFRTVEAPPEPGLVTIASAVNGGLDHE